MISRLGTEKKYPQRKGNPSTGASVPVIAKPVCASCIKLYSLLLIFLMYKKNKRYYNRNSVKKEEKLKIMRFIIFDKFQNKKKLIRQLEKL